MMSLFVFAFAFCHSDKAKSDEKLDLTKNKFCWVENSSDEDKKLERGRRRKGQSGRRRGGSGLR